MRRQPRSKIEPATTGSISVIGATVEMKGDLTLAEDLVIEGRFFGNISQGDQRLSIGENALVRANVDTGSAVIAGTVYGDVRGLHTVVVRRTARLAGSLTARDLRLEPGANLEDVVLSGQVAFVDAYAD